ncbi:MAG: PilT/PilU family type 4a pilus ATPase [Actinomycetota bacterium]|nr:PilT/PilU family type 4a pilus ATPase [Actinomycetota bacterium]
MDLDALLAHAVALGASDVHLKLEAPPMGRIDGALVPLVDDRLGNGDLEAFLARVTASAPAKQEAFLAAGDLDGAYTAPNAGRFRVNCFRQRGAISFAFRHVPDDVRTLDELEMPDSVRRLADEHRGLILVTGATGSGKSTTLAAIVDHINRTRKSHIVTIEDPIEVVHRDRGCMISQREIGLDTESYRQALRRVLRQDPDVILIGELRDEESAHVALGAGESGHLVLATMHTIDTVETVRRFVDFFPERKHAMIRQITAGVLRGVVSQRLLPRKGGGRVAAVEVMVNTPRLAELIADAGKTDKMTDAIEDDDYHGMQSFSQHLVQLVLADSVDFEVAAAAASDRHDFELALHQETRRNRAAAAEAIPVGKGENHWRTSRFHDLSPSS